MSEYSEDKILSYVDSAIKELLDKDPFLLKNDLNERTITHRLAMYLQECFPEWDVDCEYNRNHDDKKRLRSLAEDCRTDDTQGKTVFPDIIVHKRNTDENLLVIEVKKNSNPQSHDYDFKKLVGFKSELHYQFALFLCFRVGETEIGVEEKQWL